MAFQTELSQPMVTWNPVTGCTKISAGCAHCYAERYALRLQQIGQPRYRNGFRLTLQEDLVELPLTWKRPHSVFTASMSDLFHEDMPLDYLKRVFETMVKAHWHTFHVLTKRADRLAAVCNELPWPGNVAMGVTVEREDCVWRIDELRRVPACTRFLSLEPLLGPLPELDLRGIGRVLVGAESGPGARPMDPEWVWDVRRQCLGAGVEFCLKPRGGLSRGSRIGGRGKSRARNGLSLQLSLPLVEA